MAEEEARKLNHHYIGTEHLLLGLLREEQGAAAKILKSRGIDLNAVQETITHLIGRGNRPAPGAIEFVPRARKALKFAVDEMRSSGARPVGTVHLLLGLAREGQGVVADILDRLGDDLDQLRLGKLTALSQLD
jgi:ATP-dependent Clp protease ATP-binding subunit ClpC